MEAYRIKFGILGILENVLKIVFFKNGILEF